MKKIVFVLLISAGLFACKNNEVKTEETQDVLEEISEKNIFSGEFIYIADGAVLKTPNVIFAVKVDAMAEELAAKVAPVKTEDFDMVPVKVKGTLGPNPLFEETGEGWEQMLTITEIVEVGSAPAKADIKIEEKKS